MTRTRRFPPWLLPAITIGVLLLVLLVALRGQRPGGRFAGASDSTRSFEPESSEVARASGSGNAVSGGAWQTMDGDGRRGTTSSTRHLLQATLNGGAGMAGSGGLRALVGPAYISADDLAEQAAWIERGKTGAGASSLEELANVREWLPAQVAVRQGVQPGDALFGPVPVPDAPVYQVLAWNEKTSLFYHSIFSRNELTRTVTGPGETLLDGGPVESVSPTGILVRLINDDTRQTTWIARLERVVAEETTVAETVSRLLPIINLMAPEMVNALQAAEPVFFSSDPSEEGGNRLAPLLSDPAVRLILSSAAGAVARPVEIPLEPGVIRTVELDLRELFPPGSLDSVAVNGRVLMGESERPLAGALVRGLDGGPAASEVVTDSNGAFFVSAIPRGGTSRFEVTTGTVGDGRPLTPERHGFEVVPLRDMAASGDLLSSGSVLNVVWRMPAYQWLVLVWPSGSDAYLRVAPPPRYPVYILERRSGKSEPWRGGRSEHFLKEGERVAVSVTEPGEYRVLAAVTPALILESLPVTILPGRDETETVVRVSGEGVPSVRRLRITGAGDGRPVVGAQVTVSGVYRGLPPVRGTTDGEGVYLLPAANRAFEIAILASGRPPLVQEIPADFRETVEVSVP